jgi:hypothetical protein
MLSDFRKKLAQFVAPEPFAELAECEKRAEEKMASVDIMVNQRVASLMAHMDPFEPLMKMYNGIFSQEWERPEDKLDERSKLNMRMWAYSQARDPCFKYLTDWIANTQGNATLKKGNPTPDTILYGRAQISTVMLYKREIGRLSQAYEELLNKDKEFEISSEVVE